VAALLDEAVGLPRQDVSMQLALPGLLSSALERLRAAVADDDPDAVAAVLPAALAEAMPKRPSTADAWSQVSGYVAEMVREGSDQAAAVLRFMHELKPSTAIFTGAVDELVAQRSGQE
jgi:uncharacterized alpha-E superfamily protein